MNTFLFPHDPVSLDGKLSTTTMLIGGQQRKLETKAPFIVDKGDVIGFMTMPFCVKSFTFRRNWWIFWKRSGTYRLKRQMSLSWSAKQ